MIWLDFEPTKGREIDKKRPALVLSSQDYNKRTGLLICCPVSTSIRGAPTEVPISGLDKPSVVAARIVQTFSWVERQVKFIVKADRDTFREVLYRLFPLMGADEVFG